MFTCPLRPLHTLRATQRWVEEIVAFLTGTSCHTWISPCSRQGEGTCGETVLSILPESWRSRQSNARDGAPDASEDLVEFNTAAPIEVRCAAIVLGLGALALVVLLHLMSHA